MGKHHRKEDAAADTQNERLGSWVDAQLAGVTGKAALAREVAAPASTREWGGSRRTDIPAHEFRTEPVNMLVRTTTTQFELGGKEWAGGELVERRRARTFTLDPSKRAPLIPRDVMQQQFGINASLVATAVLHPQQKGGSAVRIHYLDRGETTERTPYLTNHPGESSQLHLDHRFVMATDGLIESMYQVQTNTLREQPPQGDGWRTIPSERELTVGRGNWQQLFDEVLPTPDGGAISTLHLTSNAVGRGGEKLRIDDHSTHATLMVVGPLLPGQTDEVPYGPQPIPTADNAPYPQAPPPTYA